MINDALTGRLIEGCHKQINRLQDLCGSIANLAPQIRKFESGSAELMNGKAWICLHRPESPEAAKEFCRAWGGNWFTERDGGKVNYSCKDERGQVFIFGAETVTPQPLSLTYDLLHSNRQH